MLGVMMTAARRRTFGFKSAIRRIGGGGMRRIACAVRPAIGRCVLENNVANVRKVSALFRRKADLVRIWGIA